MLTYALLCARLGRPRSTDGTVPSPARGVTVLLASMHMLEGWSRGGATHICVCEYNVQLSTLVLLFAFPSRWYDESMPSS